MTKLNNVEIFLQSAKMDEVDGEYVMFIPETKQVIMFNSTASAIWKSISDAVEGEYDITTNMIVEQLIKSYNLLNSELPMVSNDVEEILRRFYSCGLLCQK